MMRKTLPSGPEPVREHPEEFLPGVDLWFAVLAFQYGELLPERQVLQEQCFAAAPIFSRVSSRFPYCFRMPETCHGVLSLAKTCSRIEAREAWHYRSLTDQQFVTEI